MMQCRVPPRLSDSIGMSIIRPETASVTEKGDIIINPYEAATVSPSDSVHCAHTDVEVTLGGRKWGGKSRSYTPSGGRQSKHSPIRRPAEPVCEIDSIYLLAFLFDLKQNLCVDMWMYFTLCKYQLPVALIMFRYNKIQKRFFFHLLTFLYWLSISL